MGRMFRFLAPGLTKKMGCHDFERFLEVQMESGGPEELLRLQGDHMLGASFSVTVLKQDPQ